MKITDKTALAAKASCLALCDTLDRVIKESEEQITLNNNSFREQKNNKEKKEKEDEIRRISSIW